MQQLPTEMSCVGAHRQIVVSEKSIGTVVRSARTMILHATIYWPEGLLLWKSFSSTVSDHKLLLDSHVWGCPTYVLDPALQDGKKLPKWHPCKHCGQFL
eukprot:9693130-Ditylum_brightwellii.AAC.1